MKYTVVKAVLMTFFAFLIVSAPFFYFPDYEIVSASSGNIKESSVILLDAGHGGEDGGAIGVGGIIEKDLNLSVTLKTAAFFEFLGYDVEFTRETHKMTCDDGLKTQRERKVSDINNRAIKQATKDIYILYHANKPAVLVECGFISNSSEAALLSDNEYQNKIAFAIAISTVKHLTEREV